MKIFTAEQIREIDRQTIAGEPVSSIDLMERAAAACARRIAGVLRPGQEVHVFCGMGNNGGDGLAITRMLLKNNFRCTAIVVRFKNEFSEDARINFEWLQKEYPVSVREISSTDDIPEAAPVAIDALLGTGGKGNIKGLLAEVITHINKHYAQVISIDVPSGLASDGGKNNGPVIAASLTLTFQFPKLVFLLPENAREVQHFEVLDIGLSGKATDAAVTNKYYVTANDILPLIKRRPKFAHKGTFGHALLIAGSQGKSGAAIMAAEACLRSGAGLLTVHSTADALKTLNIRLPEAMTSEDEHSGMVTQVEHPDRFSAVAFGPGTGTHDDTAVVLKKTLQYATGKLIIDADGLNILAANKTWLEFLPPSTILTPHPGEFERLAGKTDEGTGRLEVMRQFTERYKCILVLKGAHTCIAMPDGNFFFNSTGNPGLAKGGTGDALTGIILGLAVSGYNAPQAALIGVFVHGLAADICARDMAEETILATDIISALPRAFAALRK